ncbi:MAG: protease pro-enzyme activation domain-containing protein [Rhodanobacter sp.]
MPSHFRLKLLAAAIGVAAATSVCAASTNNASAFVALTSQHATALNRGDVAAGPLAFSQPMQIVVSLKLRNQSQLNSFLAKAQQPGTPTEQRTMSQDQFAAQFSPTQAQAQAVANYLTQAGFKNVTIAPNRLLVTADATADSVRAAFNTTFESVHTHDGRNAFHNTSDAMIPASLQDTVLSVVGLDTVHLSHTFARYANTNAVHTAVTGTAVGHNPTNFATIYGGTGVPTASTIPVGIIVEGSMTKVLSDLKSFASTNGLPAVTTQVVGSGGSDTSGDVEWDLDSQDIVGISGGVQKIVFYDTTSLTDANLTADYNAAVSANAVKVINVSLGECETDAQQAGTTTAEDQIFSQAVAQGQTFSVSSGDSGADECGTGGVVPSWPASSQYVVAAGGTELYTSGATTWGSETVWNNLNESEGATGGSPSTFEPMPSWQVGVGQNAGHTTRGVPDIAFDASPDSGALIIVDGQANQQVGGTSLASPLFVGSWARMLAAKGSTLGFAAPLLYKLPASTFHDVTSGNNSGETAAAGWDYTTGFGSLIMSQEVANIGGGGGGTGGTPAANFSFTTSGLTANFTDSSTDSGGTLSGYSWTFGDSGTSTAQNPSHTYAAAGTYSVSETVTDSVSGATSSKTESVTVSSGGSPSQLLVNTGFETGKATPWTLSSGVLCTSASCGSSESPHAGTWFAWLDGYGAAHTDTASQSVAIPSGKTSATLQYYLHIDSTKKTAADTLTVQVLNSSGTVLSTLATFTSLNAATGYTVHTASLAPYIGQTVVIKFTGKETSSSGNTDFTLDDVTLTVQ